LRMERRLWLLRNQFTYTTGAQPRFPISLTRPALELVGEILAEYGAMLGEKIVAASQATRPFAANPEKGDPLRMVTLREDARERIAEIRETSVSSRPSATTSLTPTRIPHW
ncbi:MAG: hypothetical protein ACREN1_06955, partial [Candidatus Dormibacteria bacterium]